MTKREAPKWIFVDTGAWFAEIVPDDPDHETAKAWFRANKTPLLTTDYIIDETLTLLKARGEYDKAIATGKKLYGGTVCFLYYLTQDDIADTWEVFQRYSDKDWSFTDCSSKVVMEKLEITEAASFDKHFDQFGSVIRVV